MVAVICSLCGSGGSEGAGTQRECVCVCMCVPAEGSLITLDLWDTPSDRNKKPELPPRQRLHLSIAARLLLSNPLCDTPSPRAMRLKDVRTV